MEKYSAEAQADAKRRVKGYAIFARVFRRSKKRRIDCATQESERGKAARKVMVNHTGEAIGLEGFTREPSGPGFGS